MVHTISVIIWDNYIGYGSKFYGKLSCFFLPKSCFLFWLYLNQNIQKNLVSKCFQFLYIPVFQWVSRQILCPAEHSNIYFLIWSMNLYFYEKWILLGKTLKNSKQLHNDIVDNLFFWCEVLDYAICINNSAKPINSYGKWQTSINV